jgi:choice-of-anchor B domain-containing protein
MKKTTAILILFCLSLNITAQIYPNLNVTLLSQLDPEKDNTGSDNRKYSGCWGWYQSSKNKEYAIVGTSSKTYFIDVTNPNAPVISDSVKSAKNGCTWREMKTYQNYCYIVSDDAPPNSFQIVDMQYLPDSVHVVYDGTSYFERAHTVFVDKDKLYCGGVTPLVGSTESMHVYSLATPSVPVLVRKLSQDVPGIGYVHDMYVNNDTVFASCGGQGLFIIKLLSTNTFSLLSSFGSYPYSGYNHSSWLTTNKKTMVFADEVPTGLPAKVIDVSNLASITLVDTIRSHVGATAHNPYVIGNRWCWMSTYQDGIYLYDLTNPSNTTVHGFFDTHPQHGVNDNFSTNAYRGNWGAYPYLPSKIIIACDMQNGIFILDGDNTYKNSVVGMTEIDGFKSSMSIYPNPSKDYVTLYIANQFNEDISYYLSDIYGNILEQNKIYCTELLFKQTMNTSYLKNGCYFITIKGNQIQETKKIIIQN